MCWLGTPCGRPSTRVRAASAQSRAREAGVSSGGRGRPCWGQGEPAGPETDLSGALVPVGISRGGPTPALSGALSRTAAAQCWLSVNHTQNNPRSDRDVGHWPGALPEAAVLRLTAENRRDSPSCVRTTDVLCGPADEDGPSPTDDLPLSVPARGHAPLHGERNVDGRPRPPGNKEIVLGACQEILWPQAHGDF